MTTDLKDLKELAEAADIAEGVRLLDQFNDHQNGNHSMELGCWMDDHRDLLIDSANAVLELIARVEAAEGELSSFKRLIAGGEDVPGQADALTLEEGERILTRQYQVANAEICSLQTSLEQAKAREAELLGALERLADAADEVGVNHFDTDTMGDDVAEMQQATIAARNAVTAMGGDDNG